MGLDMYLTAERYLGFTDEAKNAELRPIADGLLPPAESDHSAITISRDVAYWRKANQIHSWFVTNVQRGKDDCGSYTVELKELEELRDICIKVRDGTRMKKAMIQNGTQYVKGKSRPIMEDGEVMVNPELAQQLLPCVSGFFFGSTDYDNWYMRDIISTIEQLEKILAWCNAYKPMTGAKYMPVEFKYHASW